MAYSIKRQYSSCVVCDLRGTVCTVVHDLNSVSVNKGPHIRRWSCRVTGQVKKFVLPSDDVAVIMS